MKEIPNRVVKMLHNGTGVTVKGYSSIACEVYGAGNISNNGWGHCDSLDAVTYGYDDVNKLHSQPFSMMNPYHTCYIWRRTA